MLLKQPLFNSRSEVLPPPLEPSNWKPSAMLNYVVGKKSKTIVHLLVRLCPLLLLPWSLLAERPRGSRRRRERGGREWQRQDRQRLFPFLSEETMYLLERLRDQTEIVEMLPPVGVADRKRGPRARSFFNSDF